MGRSSGFGFFFFLNLNESYQSRCTCTYAYHTWVINSVHSDEQGIKYESSTGKRRIGIWEKKFVVGKKGQLGMVWLFIPNCF